MKITEDTSKVATTTTTTRKLDIEDGPTLDVADYDNAYMPHTLIRVDRVTIKTVEGDWSALRSRHLAIMSGKRLDVARRQEVMLALDFTAKARWPQWLRELLEATVS